MKKLFCKSMGIYYEGMVSAKDGTFFCFTNAIAKFFIMLTYCQIQNHCAEERNYDIIIHINSLIEIISNGG